MDFFQEVEHNYFVYGNSNIKPTTKSEYYMDGGFVNTIDEFIQLPYHKIRVRYPDIGDKWKYAGRMIEFHREIPNVSYILTFDGRKIPYKGESYGTSRRTTSLFAFLNSLYGKGFAYPNFDRDHYGFIIEGASFNGKAVVTDCNEFAAKRWKDRSNYKQMKSRQESESKKDECGISFQRLPERSCKLLKQAIMNDEVTPHLLARVNFLSENPRIICRRSFKCGSTYKERFRVYHLRDFLSLFAKGETNFGTDYYLSRYLFLRLCEYYKGIYEKNGINTIKRRWKDILAGFGFNTRMEVTEETRQSSVNELLSYLVELESKFKIYGTRN